MSCASASFCAAVHGEEAETFDGQSWSSPTVIDNVSDWLVAVSCASANLCAAFDNHGFAMTFDGTGWTAAGAVFVGGGNIVGLACVSVAFCSAIDVGGEVSTFDGSRWTTPETVFSAPGAVMLSCASASFCVAVDSSGSASPDPTMIFNGSKWTGAASVASRAAALSCASPGFCMAVDSVGSIFGAPYGRASVFDGSSWSIPEPLGSSNLADLQGLTTWSWDVQPQGFGVSCVSAAFCVAVDNGGHATVFDGSSWQRPSWVDPGGALVSVSCTSPSFCMAIDRTGRAVKFDAGGRSAPTVIDAAATDPRYGPGGSVSCSSPTLCAAVNLGGDAMIFNGHAWSAPDHLGSTLDSVSCEPLGTCNATGIDDADNIIVASFNGRSWTSSPIPLPADPDGVPPWADNGVPVSFSCVSAQFCMAVETHTVCGPPKPQFGPCTDYTSTDVLEFDGSSWSAPTHLDVAPGELSCASEAFCLLVNGQGKALEFDGNSWSAPDQFEPPQEVDALSCTPTLMCVAMRHDGCAVVYHAEAATVSTARTTAALAQQLTSADRSATIPSLLAHDTAAVPFRPPAPGTIAIAWYETPANAHVTRRETPTGPVLVASGRRTHTATVSRRITLRLTTAGRRLLAHASTVTLTAKVTFTATHRRAAMAVTQFTIRR